MKTPGRSVATAIAATGLLLWPAIYNGFPLIFPDTGAYFSIAWGHFWTLDRSGFYGFLFRALSFLDPTAQLWTGLVLQSLAIASVLLIAIRRLAPDAGALQMLAVVALMALLTSLPWHSAQLMPDAFTGACVLLVWLACGRNPNAPGAPLLWLAVFATALLHYTHVGLVVAAGAAALATQYFLESSSRRSIAVRAIACASIALAIVGTQIAANGTFLKRWSPAPMGPVFLFARLHEDGLVQPWLDQHCGSGRTPALCRSAPDFPRDSQLLLWGQQSPLRPLVLNAARSNTEQAFVAELRTASLGSIRERPFSFAGSAIRAGADQFVHFRVLDDECPQVCRSETSAVRSWIRDYRPELLPSFLGSRQLAGTIPKHLFRAITNPVAILSLALLPFAWFASWRRRDSSASALLSAVIVALLANAAITGALSDVHDRYQSRLVWLAPFALLAVLLRWRAKRNEAHDQGG